MWIARLATLASIIGAALVATKHGAGYWFFMVGSVTWFIAAIRQSSKELAITNAAFIVTNIVGLASW